MEFYPDPNLDFVKKFEYIIYKSFLYFLINICALPYFIITTCLFMANDLDTITIDENYNDIKLSSIYALIDFVVLFLLSIIALYITIKTFRKIYPNKENFINYTYKYTKFYKCIYKLYLITFITLFIFEIGLLIYGLTSGLYYSHHAKDYPIYYVSVFLGIKFAIIALAIYFILCFFISRIYCPDLSI